MQQLIHRVKSRFWSRLALTALATGMAVGASVLFYHPAASQQPTNSITGTLVDSLGQPIAVAEVSVFLDDESEAVAETETQEDGSWSLDLPRLPERGVDIRIERAHFNPLKIPLNPEQLARLKGDTGAVNLHGVTMSRRVSAGFWIATLVFLGVLVVIAFDKLHSTTASLAGVSLIFFVTFVGGALISDDLFILDFERALTYINWEVIFLVMGMMVMIAVIENTGIFQWLAFQAYRLSRGHGWLLVLILMGITAVASALLDNFTTMLLMTPISLQIALALGINPLALILPEVMASNVGGISTLIGTPTNILIGAHADIGFNDFLINQTVGVVLALAGMAGYVLFHYRGELFKPETGVSTALYKKLEENGRIREPEELYKSLIVFAVVLVFFAVGEKIHMPVAVAALAGATVLLVWLKPDVHEMITAVDWTTLVFFMALFMVVGAIQEVGLISMAAAAMSWLIGGRLWLGVVAMVLGVGTLSTAIANIPLTASILPVAEFLTGTVPGASSKVLYYALSMGAAMGGNGLLIGAEANLVTSGIASRAGSPISFGEFLKVGLPVTYITLGVGALWLLVRFVWFQGG